MLVVRLICYKLLNGPFSAMMSWGGKVGTKWIKYMKTRIYMKARKQACFIHERMKTRMYFLHLVPTFPPHYIVVEKGLLQVSNSFHGNQAMLIVSIFTKKSCKTVTCYFNDGQCEKDLALLHVLSSRSCLDPKLSSTSL